MLAKILLKKPFGLLTETHKVLIWLIKAPNILVFKMAAPPDHIVDLEEAAMGWILRLISSTVLFVQLTVYSKWRITQCCAEDTFLHETNFIAKLIF